MIHIRNLSDCHLIKPPELQREVISYLLYCQYESEDDDQAFSFSVLQESDLHILNDLGPPEETVQIRIKADDHIITMVRIIYPTEVLFIPANLSNQISF